MEDSVQIHTHSQTNMSSERLVPRAQSALGADTVALAPRWGWVQKVYVHFLVIDKCRKLKFSKLLSFLENSAVRKFDAR